MLLLFHGPDEFSAHEALAQLRVSHDFGANQDTLVGAETSLDAIRTLCDTYPFLSEERLVIVDGLPKRKRASKDDSDSGGSAVLTSATPPARGRKHAAAAPDPKAFAQGLAEYAARVPPTTALVVLVDELLDETHHLLQAARRHGTARACVAPRGAQLEGWVTERARASQVSIAPDAARLLINGVGSDLRLLATEVDKLCTYVGTAGRIGAEDVRVLASTSRQARVFDLTDALARRDRTRALALLHELLAAGESPLGLVALTAFQTRALLQVKSLAERGVRGSQIAATAGLAPFVAEKSLALARQFSFAQLEAAHRRLFEVDTALKRSRMTPELALDLLVLEFGGEARA